MAPEVMEQNHGYDFKADIWSFGITAIEMATGTAPYHKYPPMKVLMLTLQNEPPTLDTGAEDRDQYKAYGKTFRKMISECLQKDPSKRPSAPELLKHSFFKKAKDRRYLVQTLVSIGPSMETRVHKASRRQPGASGRLHRMETGEWVWESEDEDEDDEAPADHRPMNTLPRAASSDEESDGEHPAAGEGVAAGRAGFTVGGDSLRGGEAAPPPQIDLVLRMRNARNELNDIRFEFAAGKDSADGIATELVGAGLIEGRDAACIARHLQLLVQARLFPPAGSPPPRNLTFRLDSADPAAPSDETGLLGFAQISIVD